MLLFLLCASNLVYIVLSRGDEEEVLLSSSLSCVRPLSSFRLGDTVFGGHYRTTFAFFFGRDILYSVYNPRGDKNVNMKMFENVMVWANKVASLRSNYRTNEERTP